MKTVGALAVAFAVAVCPPTFAHATPTVRFSAALTPKRPDVQTTAEFDVAVTGANGGLPPPLIAASIRYPNGLGIALSGLGIDTCSRATIETDGPQSCPADSFMGRGSALAAIAFGPEVVEELARATLVRGAEEGGDGQLTLLFLLSGEEPIYTQPVLTGAFGAAAKPYGGQINMSVPLIPTVPGAPFVSFERLHLVVGPSGLRYYEFAHGKTIPYRPHGLRFPATCPSGGLPFGIELTFLDGSRVDARTSVACARRRRHTA